METTVEKLEQKKYIVYQRPHHFSFLETMRAEGKLCDITIEADGEYFSLHKIVLIGTMPYFEGMFLSQFKESKQEKVTLHDIKPRNLETLINFAYTGQIIITEDTAESLLLNADFLGLRDVSNECVRFLESCINVKNVWKLQRSAELLHCDSLRDSAIRFLLQHFLSYSKTADYLEIPFDSLKEIVSNDDLQVASEELVFEAALTWLKHDVEGRRQYLPEMLYCIRLPYLTAEYLINNVLKDELIATSSQCKDIVNEVIYSRIISKEQSLFNNVKARSYNSDDGRERIVIFSREILSLMEIYNPIADIWEKFTSNKEGRMFISSAVLNDKLYRVGGEVSVHPSVEVYEPHNNTWRELSTMKSKRSFPRVVALDDSLYVCGGHDGCRNYLDHVERYCPERDEWQTVTPMNGNRYAFGAVALQGFIYVCGGYNGNSNLTSIERYDPGSDQWTTLEVTLRQDRYSFGMAVLDEKIYICGGRGTDCAALNSVEVYDPKLNTCEYVENMNTPRRGLLAVAYMGKLWAIGGNDGMDDLSTVEVYDPKTDSWSYGAPLCGTRPWVCGGVIPIY